MTIDNEFIRTHTHIVRCIVRQYGKTNYYEDLMQEGYMGLIEAAKRFDPAIGLQFNSYAAWWIRKFVREFIIRYGQTVSLPFNHKDIFDHVTEDIDATCYEEDDDEITFADILTEGSTVETDIIRQEEHQRLREAIHKCLSSREQQVINAMFGIGQKSVSQKQIAQQLGITQMTVWRIYERAQKKFKKMQI